MTDRMRTWSYLGILHKNLAAEEFALACQAYGMP
jgi:hypothetical protein